MGQKKGATPRANTPDAIPDLDPGGGDIIDHAANWLGCTDINVFGVLHVSGATAAEEYPRDDGSRNRAHSRLEPTLHLEMERCATQAPGELRSDITSLQSNFPNWQ